VHAVCHARQPVEQQRSGIGTCRRENGCLADKVHLPVGEGAFGHGNTLHQRDAGVAVIGLDRLVNVVERIARALQDLREAGIVEEQRTGDVHAPVAGA